MRDAWRLAVGTLTSVPVAAPVTVDARTAGRAMLLAPLAVGLAGAASLVTLWRRGDLDATTRRMHLVAMLGAAALAAFLSSQQGRAAIAWWRD